MDNDKEAKVGMTKLQHQKNFEFREVPEIDDRRCEEKSNEGWSDDEYTDKFVSDNGTFVSDNDKEAKVGMAELQHQKIFEFGDVPEIDDRRCEEKSNEGWSDDEYTQQKTAFNLWYCIPFIPDCLEPILEPGPFHSLGPNDKLIVNQTYNTKKDLAFAIKVEKSSKSRYQIVCMQEKCHWRLYASLIKGT
uniref:Transposase MuDR plant domain-containing protein n=1 Tax=Lactuca sativa TaxID=4236 RepID=A0A9R1WSY7_LACSA|nr:hypothetical protein LSAT_V11C100043040 [Lactuca sativa]